MSDTGAPTVAVVGSVNLDVVTEVDHLPAPGETLHCRRVRRNVGGKGANQAVAAQRAGGVVHFVGRVGDDPAGAELRSALEQEGLRVDHLTVSPGCESGRAFICVSDQDNTIVVSPGANWDWPSFDPAADATVAGADVVVCQLEVPDHVVRHATEISTARVVLNAAPARPIDPDLLARCDPLVVNESELAVLTERPIADAGDALLAHDALLAAGARSVVTTLGAAGAAWSTAEDAGLQPAPPVVARDTTGAGDVFVGYLAVRLAAGDALGEAVRWATAAAAFSVQRPGTYDSYPTVAQAADARATVPESLQPKTSGSS